MSSWNEQNKKTKKEKKEGSSAQSSLTYIKKKNEADQSKLTITTCTCHVTASQKMSKKYTSLIRKIRKLSLHIQNRHRKDLKYLEKFDKIDGCGRNGWPQVQQSLSADGQHA